MSTFAQRGQRWLPKILIERQFISPISLLKTNLSDL